MNLRSSEQPRFRHQVFLILAEKMGFRKYSELAYSPNSNSSKDVITTKTHKPRCVHLKHLKWR